MSGVWGSVLAAVAVLGVAQPCAAQQEQSARPYPALFGGGVGSTAQALTFEASLGGGYEGNVAVASTGQSVDTTTASAPASRIATTSESLTYTVNRKTLGFSAQGAGWATYYPSLATNYMNGGSGAVSVSWAPFESASLSLRQTIASQPLYLLVPVSGAEALNLPVQSAPAETTTAAQFTTQLRSQTGFGYTQKIGERVSTFLDAGVDSASSPPSAGVASLSGSEARGGVSYKITKLLSVRLAYFDDEARFRLNNTSSIGKMRGVDGGLDFSKALSLTRKTRLSFSMDTGALSDGTQTSFRVNGDVVVTRDIGRSWAATASYTRSSQFDPTFVRPVLYDGLGVNLGGYLSRQWKLTAGVGASRGDVGLGTANNGFTSGFATTSATYGLAKTLGLSVAYVYSRYEFGSGVTLPAGVPRLLSRQSVRVTLDLWVPLIRVLRSPDDVAR